MIRHYSCQPSCLYYADNNQGVRMVSLPCHHSHLQIPLYLVFCSMSWIEIIEIMAYGFHHHDSGIWMDFVSILLICFWVLILILQWFLSKNGQNFIFDITAELEKANWRAWPSALKLMRCGRSIKVTMIRGNLFIFYLFSKSIIRTIVKKITMCFAIKGERPHNGRKW